MYSWSTFCKIPCLEVEMLANRDTVAFQNETYLLHQTCFERIPIYDCPHFGPMQPKINHKDQDKSLHLLTFLLWQLKIYGYLWNTFKTILIIKPITIMRPRRKNDHNKFFITPRLFFLVVLLVCVCSMMEADGTKDTNKELIMNDWQYWKYHTNMTARRLTRQILHTQN